MASALFAGSKINIRKAILAVFLLLLFGCATTAPTPVTIRHQSILSMRDAAAANQRYHKEPDDQRIAALVALLKSKNVISAEEATRLSKRSASAAAGSGSAQAITGGDGQGEEYAVTYENGETGELNQRVSHVEQKVAELYSGKVVELAEAAPESSKRVRFSGDIRLRYEKDLFAKDNAALAQPSNPAQLMNTTIDQDRYKYRVRVGAEARVSDVMEAVVRVSTGNTSTPVSTNSILGTYLNKDNVLFDQAYIKLRPADFLTIYGGRIPNPWFSTDLLWARDLNFEGLAVNVRKPLSDLFVPFLTVGAFPLQQYDFSQHSKWLVAGQLGLERKDRMGASAKIGAAYYYFSNITGVLNDPLNPGATDWTAPLFQQKGNTLFNISADPTVVKTALASEFREVNLTGTLDIGFWDPFHVVFLGDYVRNLGFNLADVIQRTGNPDQTKETQGYQLGISVGHPAIEEFGQWKAYFNYKHVEADAVVDAFTDSDFHLGGTNAKGWILGTDFALWKNSWLTLRWLTAREISGPPLGIDVLQVDFNAKF